MGQPQSPGARFRAALDLERPLQVVGAINAFSAIMAERAGFRAIYLSGAGVANASYGIPDLGLTSLPEVLEDVSRITAATHLPLLVDVDTGWGNAFGIARTIRQMVRAGAAGVHIEDQVAAKRCGHRPHKAIVSCSEMVDRIKAAVDAKLDAEFLVMARTDALAVDGIEAVLQRVGEYVEAGADAIFAEAVTDLQGYARITESVEVPVLANITEFGKTPLYTTEQLAQVGVRMVLYPLSAFRAMSRAALRTYQAIREDGTQQQVLDQMQTRSELYDLLRYHAFEEKLDTLYAGRETEDG